MWDFKSIALGSLAAAVVATVMPWILVNTIGRFVTAPAPKE